MRLFNTPKWTRTQESRLYWLKLRYGLRKTARVLESKAVIGYQCPDKQSISKEQVHNEIV